VFSRKGRKKPPVPVKAATVQKTAIQRIVAADAVLFPLQQSALVPKISAPVKTFYVNRGSKVHKGQLLAVLENRDLAAAHEENKGAFEQAEAAYVTGTTSGVPEELQRLRAMPRPQKEQLDAAQKLYDSRLDLFKQGALPRKDLDQAAVGLAQAKPQYELAKRHLDALNAVVHQQETQRDFRASSPRRKGSTRALRPSSAIRRFAVPLNGVVTDRPLYPGRDGSCRNAFDDYHGPFPRVTRAAHIPQSDAVLLKVETTP